MHFYVFYQRRFSITSLFYNIRLTGFLQDGVSDHFLAMSSLHPICHQVHGNIYQLTTEEFKLKYEKQLKWTGKPEILLQCFTLLKSQQPGCLVTSLLLLTSTLERLLGDIFLTFSGESMPCPSLLKDSLRTRELECALGKRFMRCLEVFIGPPGGLNLRNLAWHGFLSEGELPAQYVKTDREFALLKFFLPAEKYISMKGILKMASKQCGFARGWKIPKKYCG